jgi:hypothetical protein
MLADMFVQRAQFWFRKPAHQHTCHVVTLIFFEKHVMKMF